VCLTSPSGCRASLFPATSDDCLLFQHPIGGQTPGASRPIRSALALAVFLLGPVLVVSPLSAQTESGSANEAGEASSKEATTTPVLPRDDDEEIEQFLADLSTEEAQKARAALQAFRQANDQLSETMYQMRATYIRYHNEIDRSRSAQNQFRNQRAKARQQMATVLDRAVELVRRMPTPEAAHFLDAIVRHRTANHHYDEGTFQAARQLIGIGQSQVFVTRAAARAGTTCGKFDTSRKLYEALQPDQMTDTDRRLLIQLADIEKQHEREQMLLEQTDRESLPRVLLSTTQGDVLVELFADSAPSTVAHFLKLVEQGFYDGLDFSQVTGDVLALTGDPTNDGRGNSGEFLVDEFGKDNSHPALRGSLIMAKIPDGRGGFVPNSASSQFAIAYLPLPGASQQQTIFGRVIEGMHAVCSFQEIDPTKKSDEKGLQLPPDSILRAEIVRPPAEPLPEPKYIDLEKMVREALALRDSSQAPGVPKEQEAITEGKMQADATTPEAGR